MQIFKKLLNFYINSSIHVALSVGSLVLMTQYMFHIINDTTTLYFSFFGTIVGYNFVKYEALARNQKLQMRNQLKGIIFLSFMSLVATAYYFFQLQKSTQIIAFVFFIVTLLYTLPFFPNRKNARNWAGIKIYIVALCWVGVTLILPVINLGIPITTDFYFKCIQRFLLVFVLILIFEIIDLQNDDPHLKTVPQQIGVKQTKILGFVLLFLFCFLEFFNVYSNENIKIQFIVAIVIAFFLLFSNEYCSKYYSSFWVESIPIIWCLLLKIYPIWHNV